MLYPSGRWWRRSTDCVLQGVKTILLFGDMAWAWEKKVKGGSGGNGVGGMILRFPDFEDVGP